MKILPHENYRFSLVDQPKPRGGKYDQLVFWKTSWGWFDSPHGTVKIVVYADKIKQETGLYDAGRYSHGPYFEIYDETGRSLTISLMCSLSAAYKRTTRALERKNNKREVMKDIAQHWG